MAKYKLTNTNSIIRTSDSASIPPVESNRDYADYLAWLAAGNTPDPADPVDHMGNLRAQRDAKLAASDWTQVADAPVDKAAWATYRQQLRDLPANTADPANPVWPQEPK